MKRFDRLICPRFRRVRNPILARRMCERRTEELIVRSGTSNLKA